MIGNLEETSNENRFENYLNSKWERIFVTSERQLELTLQDEMNWFKFQKSSQSSYCMYFFWNSFLLCPTIVMDKPVKMIKYSNKIKNITTIKSQYWFLLSIAWHLPSVVTFKVTIRNLNSEKQCKWKKTCDILLLNESKCYYLKNQNLTVQTF